MKLDSDSSTDHTVQETFIQDSNRDKDSEQRESWGSRLEFLLAVIGYTVGIGSIWRFPIACVRNGGGAFLVPFCLIVTFIGAPIFYLEFNLGQFTGKSSIKAFEFCQLFKGTGYLIVTMVTAVLWYWMTIMSWILYYLYSSFSSVLPWSTCNNEWNTPDCRDAYSGGHINISNKSTDNASNDVQISFTDNQTGNPAFEFWSNHVLRRSGGLGEIGSVQLHLLIALFLAWIITILGLIKGVKSLGKVVYFTALFPYVLLTILLVRGVTLEGSWEGLLFFLKFDTARLGDAQVWLDAAAQVFYSLGPLWGAAITMASHNKFNQPTFRDTVIICVTDVITPLYAALVVFSVIGFMAKETGIPVEILAKSSGPGLAFIAYPTACSLMPLPQLWAVLFFLMMLLVMLDSAFAMVEIVLDSLCDVLPTRLGKHRALVNICFAIVMFVAGVVFTTNGGIYLFQMIDWYATAFALLIGACLEVTSISLIYGIDRFSKDVQLMTGRDISRVSRFLYCFVIPIISFITFILLLTRYSAPNYGDGYIYKTQALAFGFFVGLLPVLMCLLVALNVVRKQEGTILQKIKGSLTPSKAWGPRDRDAAEVYKLEPYIYEDSVCKRLKKNVFGDRDTPWL